MNESSSPTPAEEITPEKLEAEMQRLWPQARAHWSRFLLLADPIHQDEQQSIAQIHLGSRQVSLNFAIIQDKQLFGCLEALLAHEIGVAQDAEMLRHRGLDD